MLTMLAEIGDKMPDTMPRTIFHLEHPPHQSTLVQYFQLTSICGLQDEQSILVLILIERICRIIPVAQIPLIVNSFTIDR
jgi:hypothetical protein